LAKIRASDTEICEKNEQNGRLKLEFEHIKAFYQTIKPLFSMDKGIFFSVMTNFLLSRRDEQFFIPYYSREINHET